MTARPAPEILVAPDEPTLAAEVAARLITCIADAQAARGVASIVLTGGGIGTAALLAVASAPARGAVDWSAVDFWWGDERYLPAGDPERNETGARDALLSRVPVDQRRVHAMPTAGDDIHADAAAYADALRQAARPGEAVPLFDILMLGIGPEGHVASIFPGSPALASVEDVVAVLDSPKPPPRRITLTMSAICAAREVWIIAAGSSKASAVRESLDPTVSPDVVPAAGARGRGRTLYLIDTAAASLLER